MVSFHVLYVHGFLSSSLSHKACLLRDTFSNWDKYSIGFTCPDLGKSSPSVAIHTLEQIIDQLKETDHLILIGSSLGGFYVTYLAEKYKLPAIVINPAVSPWLDLANYLGEQRLYHCEEKVQILPHFFEQLKSLEIAQPTQLERYHLFVSSDDEVLDPALMKRHYLGAKQTVMQGEDHGVTHFNRYIPDVLAVCDDLLRSFA
jgi:predicted esterase YcpF (UPF0227 family)